MHRWGERNLLRSRQSRRWQCACDVWDVLLVVFPITVAIAISAPFAAAAIAITVVGAPRANDALLLLGLHAQLPAAGLVPYEPVDPRRLGRGESRSEHGLVGVLGTRH